jgi:hypothetical protein
MQQSSVQRSDPPILCSSDRLLVTQKTTLPIKKKEESQPIEYTSDDDCTESITSFNEDAKPLKKQKKKQNGISTKVMHN